MLDIAGSRATGTESPALAGCGQLIIQTRTAPSAHNYLHYLLPGKAVYHPGMFGGRTNSQWISQYSSSHQHPINRACHTLGIPLIVLSIVVFASSILVHRLWPYALALFIVGWLFQFVGHAFEGKPPEFFSDWRFLFVGVRWWWAKVRGRA
jgi:hypothetical protein